METRANLITVGLFVLAVIAAGFGAAYWLMKGNQTGPRTPVALIFQGSVGGLLPGASVAFNGIRIGEVVSVRLEPGDANKVVAMLMVDKSAPLKVDSHAALGFTGLTGYATVQITGGTNSAAPLLGTTEGVPELMADVSSVQDVMEGAKRIMGRADQTLTTVQQLITDNAPSVTKVIKNAETFSDTLAKNSGNVDKFMASVGQTADVLTKVSGKIEKLSDDVDSLVIAVDRDKVSKIVEDVSRVSGNLANSTDKITGVLDEAKGVVADARKVMASIDPNKVGSMMDNLAKVSGDLAKQSDKIGSVVESTQSALSDARKLMAAFDIAKVSKVVDNATKISGDLAQSSGEVSGLVADARKSLSGFQDLSTNLSIAVSDARKVLAAVDPAKVSSTLDDVAGLTRHLTEKTADFDDVLAHAKSASANIDTLSGDINRKSPDLTKMIDDAGSAMHQLEVASHRVDGILANVDGLVGSDEGKGLFQQGRAFLTEATEAAKAFKEMSQTFGSKGDEISAALNRFTAQGMREVKDFVADSRKTMGTIDRAVSEFDRNPQRLIFGTNRGNVPEYGPGRR